MNNNYDNWESYEITPEVKLYYKERDWNSIEIDYNGEVHECLEKGFEAKVVSSVYIKEDFGNESFYLHNIIMTVSVFFDKITKEPYLSYSSSSNIEEDLKSKIRDTLSKIINKYEKSLE